MTHDDKFEISYPELTFCNMQLFLKELHKTHKNALEVNEFVAFWILVIVIAKGWVRNGWLLHQNVEIIFSG